MQQSKLLNQLKNGFLSKLDRAEFCILSQRRGGGLTICCINRSSLDFMIYSFFVFWDIKQKRPGKPSYSTSQMLLSDFPPFQVVGRKFYMMDGYSWKTVNVHLIRNSAFLYLIGRHWESFCESLGPTESSSQLLNKLCGYVSCILQIARYWESLSEALD